MSEPRLQTVIMAGGSGSRLWPVSRSTYPKQFQSPTESRTMLQVTAQRVGLLTEKTDPNLQRGTPVHRRRADARDRHPRARSYSSPWAGTPPRYRFAALRATQDDEDTLLLVLAADHLIRDEETFSQKIETAVLLAETGALGDVRDRAKVTRDRLRLHKTG